MNVRFEEQVSFIPSPTNITAEECVELWYSAEDYEGFRENVHTIARDSRHSGYGALLDNCFARGAPQTQRALDRWAHLTSRRGLELWSNKKHGDMRKKSQQLAIRTVLQDQQVQIKHFGKVNHVHLAQVSILLSRHAKVFAHRLGLADQASLRAVTPKNHRYCKRRITPEEVRIVQERNRSARTSVVREMMTSSDTTAHEVAIAA